MYIHKKWNVKRRIDLECSTNIETLWLEIVFKQAKPLLLCYIYRPPNSPVSWYYDFSLELEKAAGFKNEIILTGDFNVDLFPHDINLFHAEKLNDIMLLNNLTQVVMEPTRVTSTSQSLIDHIYVTDTNFVQEVKVPKIALSDHYPVCISWKKSGITPNNGENNIIIYRDATNFNQTDFINNLNTCLLDIEQIDEVNEAVNTLTMSFRSTLDKHAVLKQKRVKINRIQPAWFNAHIKTVILARNKAKRKGNKEEFKLLRNRVVSMIKTAKSQHYRNAINSNKGNSKSLWKHMRELTGQKSVKTPNAITLNDTLCNDPQVISDEFNKYFTQVAEDILNSHRSLQKVEKYETPHALHDFIARKLPNNVHYDFPGVTEEEIYKALKSLDVTKATGMDEMSAKYISLAAPVLARHLSRIINISFLNETKTNCMLICNKQRRTRLASDQLSVYIKHSMINNVSHHNVLGITIDHSLKFNVHVDNVCKRISRLRFLLGKINCYLTLEAKQTFYNSYILPIMDYCITVWGYACKSNIDKLFRYQKRIDRMF